MIILIIAGLLVIWSLWGYFSSRVEQADYTVVKKYPDYEIRLYPAHILAQTTVAGSYRQALNEGFRIVAAYIFGKNIKNESIPMTAPVTQQKSMAEKIAMTAPVLATTQGYSHIISFGMPRSYSLNNLPKPLDPRVKLVEIPEKKFAAKKFSWSRSDSRVNAMEASLLAVLARDKVATLGSPIYAGYNAPWTPPWLQRHEVMVEIS